jgi:hypothetical protein
MKLEYWESENGLQIDLTPETPKEVAELFRFANNTRAEKPSVSMYFASDNPKCAIWLRKLSPNKQCKTVSNE